MMKTLSLFLCVSVALLVCGCELYPSGIDGIGIFGREWQLWLEQDIQNYSFVATVWEPDYPNPRGTVFVQDGGVRYFWNNSTNMHSPGASTGGTDLFSNPPKITISEIYAEIERYANKGNVKVRYNTALHYPTYIKWQTSYNKYKIINIEDFTIDPVLPGMEDRSAFENERRLWLEQGIQNYSFSTIIGEPGGERPGGTVFVQDGRVIYFGGSYVVNGPDISTGFATTLFSSPSRMTISEIYERIRGDATGGYVQVLYDATSHYPTYVHWRLSVSTYKEIYINQFTIDPQLPAP